MQYSKQYRLRVKLLSEAIFSSGEKEANTVHNKVLTDEYGFVYYHAKTLKGMLKSKAIWLLKHYARIDDNTALEFLDSIQKLFGMNNEELKLLYEDFRKVLNSDSIFLMQIANQMDKFQSKYKELPLLRFGHLELPEAVRSYYQEEFFQQKEEDYTIINKHDLIEAQTHVRVAIQLKNGIIENKMLMNVHTVKKGLIFYAPIYVEVDLNERLKNDLLRIVKALDRIGAAIHRGSGDVEVTLESWQPASENEKGGKWDEVKLRCY